jgi:TetR/AcrR family transcriptional regulator, fatty acid metabolism regulator protein
MVYRTTPKIAARKEARKRRLIETAVRLFGTHGYAATTVPMIVRESGSSTGSFYFYFKNKEDVFACALEWLGQRIAEAVNQATAVQTNPLLQMRAAVEGFFLFLAQNPTEARILLVESSGLSERLEGIRRKMLASHAKGVESALVTLAPVLPPIRPAVAAWCWVGAVYQTVWWWLEQSAKTRPPVEQIAIEVADFNLRAIGADSQTLAAADKTPAVHGAKKRPGRRSTQ